MLSLVKELTKPRRELYKIKVLNIFSPNILIATFEDCRKPIPATSEYLTMEHRIARGWHHSPGWNFTASPDVGTVINYYGLLLSPMEMNMGMGCEN